MVYLYLGRNSIKVLSLTKTLLGQYNLLHFSKTHSTELIKDGTIQEIDLVASAIKEALTHAKPEPITDKDIVLVLPQEAFLFGRYKIPADISETAIIPFAKDKVRNDLKISLESTNHDYLINSKGTESTLLFYAMEKGIFGKYEEVMKLLRLKITRIIPETVVYYTLFEKTLRKDKNETIIYASYKNEKSFAYVYDSLGLIKNQKKYLGEDVKVGLKQLVADTEQEGTKVNRLILSGSQASKVRQDHFTKEVGAWTNPLDKIIENFYKDYLKMIIPNETEGFSILQYDVCFGAFVFSEENKQFTLIQQTVSSSGSGRIPKVSLNVGVLRGILNMKTLGIFAISLLISFGLVFGLSEFRSGEFGISIPQINEEPTSTPVPTEQPTPTPSVVREDLKVKVLNGSGVAGKAGEVEDILQDAGYTDIVTDNADAFDYEITEVQIMEGSEDALPLIQEDLADYVEITDASTIDDEDETADVIIIVGADFIQP